MPKPVTFVTLSAVTSISKLPGRPVIFGNRPSARARSKGKGSRTLVKTDETGTIILIGPPNLRLTARDKDGKLLFDGEIETDEQRAKVPKEVWERVEPMIEKEALEKAEAEKKESDSKP